MSQLDNCKAPPRNPPRSRLDTTLVKSVNKAVLAMSSRAFLDKRILFHGDSEDEVFIYYAQVPASALPIESELDESYVLGETVICLHYFRKEGRQVLFESYTQADAKLKAGASMLFTMMPKIMDCLLYTSDAADE